jgi:hypothetical protein
MPAGFGGIVFYATSDQAVTLTVTRYADLAGTILIDVSTQALVIATPGSVGTTDKVPYLSFVAAIANTTGSTANMTNMQILTGQFQ